MTAQAELFQAPDLVRGNVKAAMKDIQASSADLWNVPPSAIKFMDGFNVREHTPAYEAHIEWITQSIIDNGYYQDKPIAAFVVDDPKDGRVIFATDGHTRVTAALRAIKRGAPLETIPVVVKPKGTNMEDITVGLITSNEGKPLEPYEKAKVVKRLVDMGLSEKDIAKRIGMTPQYVGNLLTLIGAPKAIRDMVASGEVSASVAVKQLQDHGSKAVERLQKGLSTAKADGKGKVSPKHLKAPSTLKIKGLVGKSANVTGTTLTIYLDSPLDVEVIKGSKVRLVIVDVEDEL